LCEAAQTAKRSPQFAATFQAIARRRGKKIATTAVARKLLTRAWHLLTDAERAAIPQPATTPAPESRRSSQTRRGRQAPGELADRPEPAMPRSNPATRTSRQCSPSGAAPRPGLRHM
jgi:hypothetical protein